MRRRQSEPEPAETPKMTLAQFQSGVNTILQNVEVAYRENEQAGQSEIRLRAITKLGEHQLFKLTERFIHENAP